MQSPNSTEQFPSADADTGAARQIHRLSRNPYLDKLPTFLCLHTGRPPYNNVNSFIFLTVYLL
jgi:hypothetical protein